MEPVEVGQGLGPIGFDDQAGRPMAPVAEPVPHVEPEQPKRRSTVREPAPTFTSGQGFTPSPQPEPTPAPASEAQAPAITAAPAAAAEKPAEPSSSDDGKPRKTGWWAKRLLGQ
jgi:ribonuclease E